MESCTDKWLRMKTGATAAEKKIISYLLENPLSLPSLSMEQLAERSGTSYASVARFCRRLRFSGFREMKRVFVRELENDYYTGSRPANATKRSFTSMNAETCAFYSRVIGDCRLCQSEETLSSAVFALIKAKNIFFIGQGTSSIVAKYAYIKFLRLGIPCSFDNDSTTLKARAALLCAGDALFAVSSSGRTKPIVEAAGVAAKFGARVISLGDYIRSPLASRSGIVLSTTTRNVGSHMTEDMPLTVGQLAIIDTLWAGCVGELTDAAGDTLVRSQEQVFSEKLGGQPENDI